MISMASLNVNHIVRVRGKQAAEPDITKRWLPPESTIKHLLSVIEKGKEYTFAQLAKLSGYSISHVKAVVKVTKSNGDTTGRMAPTGGRKENMIRLVG